MHLKSNLTVKPMRLTHSDIKIKFAVAGIALVLTACGGSSGDSPASVDAVGSEGTQAEQNAGQEQTGTAPAAPAEDSPVDGSVDAGFGQPSGPIEGGVIPPIFLGGSSRSNVVNGFYLTRETTTFTDAFDANNNTITLTEFTVANGTNTIEASIFRDGVLSSEYTESFSDIGDTLTRTFRAADGSITNTETFSYADNGFIRTINSTNDTRVEFVFSGSLQRYEFSVASELNSVVDYTTNTSNQIIRSEDGFVEGDFNIDPNRDCDIEYVNSLRTSITCFDYTGSPDDPLMSSMKILAYDVNGNHVSSSETLFELFGQTDAAGNSRAVGTVSGTSVTTYEYTQTDRAIPNSNLLNRIYFPQN